MRKECNIIRDLLPLYAENMVCADTEEFVKEHLEQCAECRKEYEQMKGMSVQKEQEKQEGTAPLVALKRKLWKKRMQTVVCTGLFVIALLVSAFAVFSAPVYIPYEENLLKITENADESITIMFDERVTDYSCESDSYMEAGQCYQIEAWTSLWNQWFSKRGVQYVTIPAEAAENVSVYYCSNDGTEDICVYGQPITSGGVITLPRLVLGYYFLLAGMCAVVLLAVWCVVRRNPKKKAVVETMLLYPLSYGVGHLIVTGFDSGSYAAQRDFMLIVFLSVVIYGGLLLVRSICKVQKEIKELVRA